MYQAKFYKTIDREKIEEDIRKEGFDPLIVSNTPGFVYEKHQHQATKLLAFLKGSMNVKVGDKIHHCEPGDKLVIPGNTLHESVVNRTGCTFFWSEKVLE